MKQKLSCKDFPLLLAGILLILVGLLTGCFHSSSSPDRGNDTDNIFPTDRPEDSGTEVPDYSPSNPPNQTPSDPVP